MDKKKLSYSLSKKEYLLHQPLIIGQQNILTRESLLLTGRDNRGIIFNSEFAPLPGLHEKDVTFITNELNGHLKRFPSLNASPSLSHESNILLELARFDILRRVSPGIFFNKFNIKVNPNKKKFSPLNISLNKLAFIGHSVHDFKTTKKLKLKIGREILSKEIHWILSLIKINPNILLILDGNQKLSLPLLENYHRHIPEKNISYWEEPLKNADEMFLLNENIPLGLDESLLYFIEKDHFPKGVAAWIIKPTMVGGIAATMAYIQMAKKKGLQTVISSTFDPPSFFYYLGLLSHLVDSSGKAPMGLDTLKFFKDIDLTQKIPLPQDKSFLLLSEDGGSLALEI